MKSDPHLESALATGIDRSIARARESGRTRWVAQVVEVEIDGDVEGAIRCYAHAGTRDRFFWERVEHGESLCAWGCVHEIETGGSSRFRDVRAWKADLTARLDWVGGDRPESSPIFVGGFGFDEVAPGSADWKSFPAARFMLPEVIVLRRAGRGYWILFARVEPGVSRRSVEATLEERLSDAMAANVKKEPTSDGPSENALSGPGGAWAAGPEYLVRSDRRHSVFRAQIRRALSEIERGGLAKVVLARSLSVDHDDDFDVPAFVGRLRLLYPSCTLVAVGRGSDTFLAATPERLIRVAGRRVETAALAGSIGRGRHPDEDRALAGELLESPKENSEHRHVVDAIRAALVPRCDELQIPDRPRLRALFGIQHLETPIRGTLARPDARQRPTDILDLVGALHPTPAVCGVPREAAKGWLRGFEGLSRGWYAAPVGWLDLDGGGDFCVALRSALIRNRLAAAGGTGASRAILFAGAGIVSESDPESELDETRIKLRALLAPLTEI